MSLCYIVSLSIFFSVAASVTSLPVSEGAAQLTASQERTCQTSRGGCVESVSVRHPALPEADNNPDEAKRKRLRLRWGKPKVVDKADDPYLEISGTLLLDPLGGKAPQPVDWLQPVRVVLGRTAKDRPDWSKPHDRSNSVWADAVAGAEVIVGTQTGPDGMSEPIPIARKPAGEFTVTFSLRRLRRPIGDAESFQIGLCLGRKKGDTLTWENTSVVLPQSVSTVVVTGPAPISRTLQLINACPSPLGWDYDPVALVRASNHLRSLGKDKAIDALREFVRIAHDPGYGRSGLRDPENIDDSDQWCLDTLVPLIFARAGPKGEEPPLDDDWITVWEGIPFHKVRITDTSGRPPRTAPLVEWAAKHARLLEAPLRPANRPLEAADGLLKSLLDPKDLGSDAIRPSLLREHIRAQAWRMIGHLVEPGRAEPRSMREFRSNKEWAKLKEKAASLNIRWNKKRQEYVVEKP